MRKKALKFVILTLIMIMLMPVSVSARGMRGGNFRTDRTNPVTTGVGYGYGMCGGMGYGFMWDDEGNFVERETFESRIDDAIEKGYIPSEYKDNYLNMYDYCAEYGSDGLITRRSGGRSGCCRGGGGTMWYAVP